MSFFEDASLVYIPSAVKDAKTYSVKPTDGSGDLTFSRGSDIEATRVGPNGYIEKAKVNLLLQSNTFSTTWTIANASITGGQADKDGGSTAWKLEATTNSPQIQQSISAGNVTTYSVYAKAGTNDWIRLLVVGSTNYARYFNLSNGTKGSSVYSTEIDSNIVSVGGGWYRVDITTNSTITSVRIFTADGDGTQSTTSSGNIYIQDAQLNYGLVAQDYVETTTASVVEGITNDMPRLSYDPANPTCPSLLLEGSRTNLINQSEWFGGHTLFASNVNTNSLTSPEGVLNGSEVRANSGINLNISTANGYTAGASAYVAKNVGTLTASTYTFSTFVKKTDLNLIQLRAADGSDLTGANAAGSIIDLDTYTLVSQTNCTTTIEPYALGWYRVSITFTATAATWYVGFWYWNKTSITVDGTQGYGLYGSQLELGGYVSSMVPTYGTSATRTADACSKTGISSLIGQTEGTLFAEVDAKVFEQMAVGDTQRISMLSDNTNNNRVILNLSNTVSGLRIEFVEVSGGALQASVGYTAVDGNKVYKIAGSYKTNDFKFYVDGVERGADTSGNTFSGTTLSRLDVGQDRTSTLQASNPIKQLLVFKTALTASQLAEITA